MNASSTGIWMLLVLVVLVLRSGLPVWYLLIGVASLFAVIGCASEVMDVAVLGAAGSRVLGILDSDLLQALPLYVFVGVLLTHISVGDALFAAFSRLFSRTGAGASLAGFGLGLVLAPMNGSVASSSALMARLLGPHLDTHKPADRLALMGAAATIGVVVPPSLVLILLGDTMMRADTEASNLPGYQLGLQHVINTQDVFHAAVVPAVCVLLLWGLVAWWLGRGHAAAPKTAVPWRLALVALTGIVVLLGGVFLGKFLAVEAAATGALALTVSTVCCRALSAAQWRDVVAQTMRLSGALLALLVGATTFSLVFRLWGTDQWIANQVLHSSLSPHTTAALVLLAVALCASVLDAFEMVFVIIPIFAPLLVLGLGDAQQVAVLLLLVLQTSYLIPPMGYAVLLSKAYAGGPAVPTRSMLRALWPYLAAQCAVIALVFTVPNMVHALDASRAEDAAAPSALPADIDQQMRDMSEQSRNTSP